VCVRVFFALFFEGVGFGIGTGGRVSTLSIRDPAESAKRTEAGLGSEFH